MTHFFTQFVGHYNTKQNLDQLKEFQIIHYSLNLCENPLCRLNINKQHSSAPWACKLNGICLISLEELFYLPFPYPETEDHTRFVVTNKIPGSLSLCLFKTTFLFFSKLNCSGNIRQKSTAKYSLSYTLVKNFLKRKYVTMFWRKSVTFFE